MATTAIGYRGFDLAVGFGAGGTFITRAQSYQVTKTIPTMNTYELGTTEATGAFQDAESYRGVLVRNSVDDLMEGAFGSGTKTLTAMIEADGIQVKTALFGILDAKFVSVVYAGRVGGFATETWTFTGTSGSVGAISATTPVTGAAGSRHPKMSVSTDVTTVRAQGYTIRATARGNELSELNNASIVGTVFDQPSIAVDVDWVQSTNAAGDSEFALGSEQDITVTLTDEDDTTIKIITVQDCITAGLVEGATVGGWATEAQSYQSLCNTVDSGLTITTA